MQERIITLATPIFFLLIGIELLTARQMKRQVYHSGDLVASIGLGILSQVTGVFSRLLRIGLYALAYQHVALWHLAPTSPLVWVAALLSYDLCYYWLHRAGHEINLFWAAHVVHHQSEFYNLSTALRQTSSGVLLGWLFYLPMAVLGFPVEVFAAAALIDLLYQFWVHTELIGRLGALDRIVVTPSNHRVHHAVNQRYLDRNYGGILILWDRLFGTFQAEESSEPCVYGTRSPLRSFNPLWANAEVYSRAVRDTLRSDTWRDRIMIWLGPPGWQSTNMAKQFPQPEFNIKRQRHVPALSRIAIGYGMLQFALLVGLAADFLDIQPRASIVTLCEYGAYLLVSVQTLCAFFDRRSYALAAEAIRLVATASAVVVGGRWFARPVLEQPVISMAVAFCGVSLVLLVVVRRDYSSYQLAAA